ncbi:hypothetical protein OH773_21930 (plasmid) [Buttiauxella sp. WJP83]|uniref:hypothetical protein n=1 Tax=Buttiauxella sp. WJP83 TaxID=2986951 RepID=UPI0022DE14BB|nr:hypothetical protein [Buttiauxella sp. WJP83]WBM73024.1 hypothetical protein OH773_21930 [Buttiauxella sp. WJP83]
MTHQKTNFELVMSTIQVLSVVAGVILSVLKYTDALNKETEVRLKEASDRAIEANRPFIELRRIVYLEAVKTAAIIAIPEGRSTDELNKAKRRFQELYIAELSMVEDDNVARSMVALAQNVDPELINLTPAQNSALKLAHALKCGYQHSNTDQKCEKKNQSGMGTINKFSADDR